MANEIGQGAESRGSAIPNWTFVSKGGPATMSGQITAIRVYMACTGDDVGIKVALFTASGDNLTTVVDSIRTLTLDAQVAGVKEWTVAGEDFIAIDVNAGEYLGVWTPDDVGAEQQYAVEGGDGVWYISGDYTDVSGQAFTLGGAWLDSFEGDITTGGGSSIVPIVLMQRRLRS